MAKTTTLTVHGREFRVWFQHGVGQCWMLAEYDAEGNQVGDAGYAATRDMALVYVGIEASRPR